MAAVYGLWKSYPHLPKEDQELLRVTANDATKRIVAPAVVASTLAWLPWRLERLRAFEAAQPQVRWYKRGVIAGAGAIAFGVGYHFVVRDLTAAVMRQSPQSLLRRSLHKYVMMYNPHVEDAKYRELVKRYDHVRATEGEKRAEALLAAGQLPPVPDNASAPEPKVNVIQTAAKPPSKP